jgi:hypothetical protein
MNESSYPFTLSRQELRYEFVSVSAEKEVRKVVLLNQTEELEVYNLALLDVLDDGRLCDMTETNNNDLKTVIATVFQILNDFFDKNSLCYVMFRGSDLRRQRLYRLILNREYYELSQLFEIFGVQGGVPRPFAPNTDYEFYLIRKL